MEKVEKISREELQKIKQDIGEAFVTNELFHEFGNVSDRQELVMKYMDAYVQFVYESGCLYRTKDGKGYIGLAFSKDTYFLPQMKMLFRMICFIPRKVLGRFMKHIRQISGCNQKYAKQPHVEVLMVCVKKDCQGQGVSRKMVEYAKEMAVRYRVPLLFDTDMKDYAQIYEHLGCTLYNQVTADNGVTRYSLVWESVSNDRERG